MVVGVVGMGRAEQVLDRRVVLGLLVGVANQQADGATGGLALEHAGEDFHLIGFLALSGVAAGTRLAPIQIALQVGLRQFDTRRATVDNGHQGRAMAFAGGGNSKQLAVGIARHAECSAGLKRGAGSIPVPAARSTPARDSRSRFQRGSPLEPPAKRPIL